MDVIALFSLVFLGGLILGRLAWLLATPPAPRIIRVEHHHIHTHIITREVDPEDRWKYGIVNPDDDAEDE